MENLRRAGFTLIEMTVVIAVLVIIAGAIMPRATAFLHTRSVEDMEANVARLPIEARNEAVKTQIPTRLRISGTSIIMEQAPATGEATQVKEVDLGKDIAIDSVQLNGKDSDTGSWQWTVYPDGSSDTGGIQFSEGSSQRALAMASDGSARWTKGALPDAAQSQWTAGSFVPRTTTATDDTSGT